MSSSPNLTSLFVKDETLAKLLPPLRSLEWRIVIFKIGIIIATLEDLE